MVLNLKINTDMLHLQYSVIHWKGGQIIIIHDHGTLAQVCIQPKRRNDRGLPADT